MYVRSVDVLEQELKDFLSNPHSSKTLAKAVNKAKKILSVDKKSNYANYTLALHKLALANKTAPMVDYTDVVNSLEKIIKSDPKFLEAYLMLVKLYREIDRNKEYQLLLKANDEFPDHYLIMFDLANMMCFRTGEKEKGLEFFGRCVQKLPMVDSAWAGTGSAYLITRNFEMALTCFETAISINPDNVESILGIGVYYFEHGNFDKAREYYEKSIKVERDNFWGNFNLALLKMLQGDYIGGLEGFEKRNKDQFLKKYGGHGYVEMLKNDIKKDSKQKIVILREQGFGDDIMFSRYLKPFKELGYDITFACQPELEKFFRLFPELDEIKIMSQIPQQPFDKRTFLMSLPWLMSDLIKKKINKPLALDYERFSNAEVDIPKKLKEIVKTKKLKVGIAWSGRPSHMRDNCRNMRLDLLDSLFKNKDIEFFAVQKIEKKEDIKFLKKYSNVHNLSDDLKSFMHTAFFIDKMDVVFTIDTSLVHLAGTMNKKTYLFLPFVPDYRWGLKETQEWYPSVSLLRQKKQDEWDYPINECKKIIKKLSKI